jgi:DNA-binding GntR family transcriptional regulator
LPKRRVLTDEVHATVLGLLMDLTIEPGGRVSIDGLARDLQVSPTPVREALARLEADGLVVKRPLQGYLAAPLLDEAGFAELFEMRLLLEPAGARGASAHMDDATLDELDRSVQAMRADASSAERTRDHFEGYREFAAQDARFHELIADCAGNRLLAEALTRLRAHRHLYRLYTVYFQQGIAVDTANEHQAILDALRRGDVRSAGAAMRAHLTRSRDRIRSCRPPEVSPEGVRTRPHADAQEPSAATMVRTSTAGRHWYRSWRRPRAKIPSCAVCAER